MRAIVHLCLGVVNIIAIVSPVAAESANFPAATFIAVQSIVCRGWDESPITTCRLEDFTIDAHDLDGDGQREWFFYGPHSECGAHGNCPLRILQYHANDWRVLSNRLKGGNAFYTHVAPTIHNGYHDLVIGSDNGAMSSTQDVYRLVGPQYELVRGSTRFFLGTRRVSQQQFERCSRTGELCR